MGKTLIIGYASGYDWDNIKHWITSIKATSFAGDIVLVTTNISADTLNKLNGTGIISYAYGKQADDGSYSNSAQTVPHVERFFYLWSALDNMSAEDYDQVITTDVRDVYFNRNPELHFPDGVNLAVSSEGMNYRDEPWGNNNLADAYGPYFHYRLADKPIFNVGVIGGRFEHVKKLLLNIFLMSINRPIQIVDQASFNVIIHEMYPEDQVWKDPPEWAVNLGTTPMAVLNGVKGDLAYAVYQGRLTKEDYLKTYYGPAIDNEETYKALLSKYAIWHQWERIPDLAGDIEGKPE